jgi:hypothetical protein
MPHYEIDTAALDALASLEDQVAKELGQYPNKIQLTGENGGPIEVTTQLDVTELLKLSAGELTKRFSQQIPPTLVAGPQPIGASNGHRNGDG